MQKRAALTARVHEINQGGDGVFPSGEFWWSGAVQYLTDNKILSAFLGDSDYYQDLPNRLEKHYITAHGDTMGEPMPFDHGPWADQPLNRLRAAAWLRCALPAGQDLEPINTVGTLPDEPEESGTEWPAIKTLYQAGILAGSDNWGTFYGQRTITRAEFAAILVRAVRPDRRLHFTLLPQVYTEISAEQVDFLGTFHGGLAAARDTYSYREGYMNTEGQWAIEPVYRQVGDFIDGAALVRNTAGAYQLIDTTGKVALDLSQYRTVSRTTSGNMVVSYLKNGEKVYGLLDESGKELVPVQMKGASIIGEKDQVVAFMNDEGKYAVFSLDGKRQTDFLYTQYGDSGLDNAVTYTLSNDDGTQRLYYDIYGKEISPFLEEHLKARIEQGYLYDIRGEGTGFMDLNGNVVIPPHTRIENFTGWLFTHHRRSILHDGRRKADL